MEDAVLLQCLHCGEEEQQVLRAAESGWTLKCTGCGHVRTAPAPPRQRTTTVPAVLADGAASRTVPLELPLDGPVGVNDEFSVEGHRIRITALERVDGARATTAAGRDLRSISAKVYDTLSLRVSLNEGERTRSFRLEVEPERRIEVGEELEIEGLRLRVVSILSDDFRTMRKGSLEAPRVRRVLCQNADKPRPPKKVVRRSPPRSPRGRKPPPRSRKGSARRA